MDSSSPGRKKKALSDYMPQLDSLRGLAVVAVLLGHFGDVPIAIEGVLLFFVLSGYLITGILLDGKPQIENGALRSGLFFLRQFYVRRFLRIFPPYYALLLILILVQLAVRDKNLWGTSSAFWRSISFHASYTSNFWFAYTASWQPWATSHFWSLAIEEQFYVFWPLVILSVPRRQLWIAGTLLVASGLVFRGAILGYGVNKIALGTLTPTYFLVLGLGAFLAIVQNMQRAQLVLRLFGAAAIIALAIHSMFGVYVFFSDMMLWGLAFTGVVSKASEGFTGPVGSLLTFRPLRYLGRVSYGIYLYHLPVLALLIKSFQILGLRLPPVGAKRLALAGTITVAVAALSWRFLEAPINRLKRFFPYPASQDGFVPAGSDIQSMKQLENAVRPQL